MANVVKNNTKLKTQVAISFISVLVLSLVSGLALGHSVKSPLSITFFVIAILISIYTMIIFYQNISKYIRLIIKDLNETSSNLKLLSDDLTTTGHKLAEGSTEQAASIQETSSTLEEESSMVHQTTQNTREANVLAKQTKEAADKGNVEMSTMLSSMEELKKSSDEIAKIIKVIDEIAFQTNILSLNAAVEAARAGEAGKGFAVVAEEVRNLAQRSASAAKDTTAIIESNISLSEKCLQITKQVGGSLSDIKEDTHKVSELIDEISSASQEQEIGITQINQAISQMETVLQANASTAQESAASADQLSNQSDELKQIISNLSGILNDSEAIVATAFSSKPSKSKTMIPKMERPKTIQPAKIKPKEEKIIAVTTTKKEKDSNIINPEEVIPLEDF